MLSTEKLSIVSNEFSLVWSHASRVVIQKTQVKENLQFCSKILTRRKKRKKKAVAKTFAFQANSKDINKLFCKRKKKKMREQLASLLCYIQTQKKKNQIIAKVFGFHTNVITFEANPENVLDIFCPIFLNVQY